MKRRKDGSNPKELGSGIARGYWTSAATLALPEGTQWNICDSRARVEYLGDNNNTKLYRDRSLRRDTLPLWHNYAGPVSRLHCHFYTSSSSSASRKPGNTHTVETDLFIVMVVVVVVVIITLLFLVCPDVTDDDEKSLCRLARARDRKARHIHAKPDSAGEYRTRQTAVPKLSLLGGPSTYREGH